VRYASRSAAETRPQETIRVRSIEDSWPNSQLGSLLRNNFYSDKIQDQRGRRRSQSIKRRSAFGGHMQSLEHRQHWPLLGLGQYR